MRSFLHKNCQKQLDKLPSKIQETFNLRVKIFLENQYDSVLNFHALKGERLGLFSINITGDYRAIFRYLGDEDVIFLMIGRHSGLYGK